MRLVVDLDGVLVDFDRGWTTRHRRTCGQTGCQVRPRMDQPYDTVHSLAHFETRQAFWLWFGDTGGFYDLPAVPGAVSAIRRLQAAGWDVEASTARPPSLAVIRDTQRWMAKHSLDVDVWFDGSPGKQDTAAVGPPAVLVDDSPEVLSVACQDVGWMQVYRMVWPWNTGAPGVPVAGWDDLERLLSDTLEKTYG